jgi:hypothetical protein
MHVICFLQTYHKPHKKFYKLFANFLQTSYKLLNILQTLTNILQTYYKPLIQFFLQTSYTIFCKHLTNILQTSYKHLTNILQTSYKLLNILQTLSNMLQTSYKPLIQFFANFLKHFTNIL